MKKPNIIHLGGENTVTGSCHLLQANGLNIMVDCGLAQGDDSVMPMEAWPVKPSQVDYLFLTHAHIDHIGRVPELIEQGFSGEDYTVIFSGDLGCSNTPILPDPDRLDSCDLLVLESTYGARNHEGRKSRIEVLRKMLGRALDDGGIIYIPAFSLGRTQELIYELDRIRQMSGVRGQGSGRENRENELAAQKAEFNIPVFIDSPLGLEITKIYSSLDSFWDKEAKELKAKGDHPIDFKNLYSVERFRDHKKLLEMDGPAVIIAGSGMCTGGRILNHLRHGLDDPKNDIFFVGYQAKGTPGRDIMRYSKRPGGYVVLDGEKFDIKARVHALSGYSAHADQKGLLEWVASMPERPGRIKLVHGEARAQKALGEKLDEFLWNWG